MRWTSGGRKRRTKLGEKYLLSGTFFARWPPGAYGDTRTDPPHQVASTTRMGYRQPEGPHSFTRIVAAQFVPRFNTTNTKCALSGVV